MLIPAAASAATGYVSGRTKMRAGPDSGYPTVATIRRGEGVTIHGCLSNRSWCDVGFKGERGWLPADSILGKTVRGRVPVATMDSGVNTMRFNLDEYWDTNYHGRFDKKRGDWQNYYRDHNRDTDHDGVPNSRDDHPRDPRRD
jgi:uncharacterized protein YraI